MQNNNLNDQQKQIKPPPFQFPPPPPQNKPFIVENEKDRLKIPNPSVPQIAPIQQMVKNQSYKFQPLMNGVQVTVREKKNDEIPNQNMTCIYVDHETKAVLGVCVNRKCDKNRLYCQNCMKQFHDQHIKDLLDFSEFNVWRSQGTSTFEKTKNILSNLEFQIKQIQDLIFNMIPLSDKPLYGLTNSEINKQTIQLIQIHELNQLTEKNFGRLEEFAVHLTQIVSDVKVHCSLIQIQDLNDRQTNKMQIQIINPQQGKFQQIDFSKLVPNKGVIQKQPAFNPQFVQMPEKNLEIKKVEQNIQELEKAKQQIAKLEKDIGELQQNSQQRQKEAEVEKNQLLSQISELQLQAQKYNQKITELEAKLSEAQNKIAQRKQQIFQLEYVNKKLQVDNQGRNQSFQNEQQFMQQENQNRRNTNSQIQTIDQLFSEASKALEREAEKQVMVSQKSSALQQKGGIVQCCFVTDFPKNGEKYQQSIINSIKCCCEQIKQKTGRDSLWGAISYAGNTNVQQFTSQPEIVEQFFMKTNKVKFVDKPEDLKAALQLVAEMIWDQKYKFVIIISASACHGKIYQHPSKFKTFIFFDRNYDSKPDDNIELAIMRLIEQNIVLLGIRYTDETEVMYNELQKIYKMYERPDLFFTLKIENMNKTEDIVKKINTTIEHVIGTKNQSTKSRINKIRRQSFLEEAVEDMKSIKNKIVEYFKQNDSEGQIKQAQEEQIQFEQETRSLKDCKDGALEALYKKGDIEMFETQVPTVKFTCNVYKIDFKYQIFEKKKENIQEIGLDDIACGKGVNQWNCIRTESHFAVGMMKKVYIIKNLTTKEIYAGKVPIQGPYTCLNDAIFDCRAHLISKTLMQEFMEKVLMLNSEYPNITYTDFYILEETNRGQPQKYWFVEKFMSGEFKKYNNNDGFISDENTILNSLAQNFSYYTYYESKGNYIVNDIQGFDNYFTDPAINTLIGILICYLGKFDETDNGEEGITNFFISLSQKRYLCGDILDSIGIELV